MNVKKFGYFVVLGLALTSCAASKQVATTAAPEKTASRETLLTEDQENEFEYLFIEGIKQKKLGNVSNAISIFSRCLEIDPQSAVAMYENGYFALRQ